MTAYNRLPNIVYNEFDEQAAAWLRELIRRGLIAPGEVDTRSIVDVKPDDLRGVTQFHAFAGIGVWSYAARLAGWPDDRPLWTGSPPCQPFSAAGKGLGEADERHLWPAYFHLLDVCRPDEFFGEQVASKDALAWLDPVSADVEGAGYAFGAFDLCAAGFGAPHIRQRLKFVGTRRLADAARLNRRSRLRGHDAAGHGWPVAGDHGPVLELGRYDRGVTLGDALGAGLEGHAGYGYDARGRPVPIGSASASGELGGLALPDDPFWRANLTRGDHDDGSHAGRAENAGDARPGRAVYGMADDASGGWREERQDDRGRAIGDSAQGVAAGSLHGGSGDRMADSDREGRGEFVQLRARWDADSQERRHDDDGRGSDDRMADDLGIGREVAVLDARGGGSETFERQAGQSGMRGISDLGRPGPTNGLWGDADWLLCRDGKWRPVEPGTFPLAHGAPARVGRLRGYGNAIVAPAAAHFIASYLEAERDGFRDPVQSGRVIDADFAELLG